MMQFPGKVRKQKSRSKQGSGVKTKEAEEAVSGLAPRRTGRPSCVRRPGMVGWMQNRRKSCSDKEKQGLYWGFLQ